MGTKEKVELLQEAIKRLMEEDGKENPQTPSSSSLDLDGNGDRKTGQHRTQLVSKLLSQLEEELRVEGSSGQSQQSSSGIGQKEERETGNEGKIIKELKEVKKQNFITHCLMSALIVLTVAWQLSEVSLILTIKDGLSHPVRSLGRIVTGMLRSQDRNGQNGETFASAKQKQIIQSASLPGIKIPELPHVEFPHMELPCLDFEEAENV